MNFVVLDSLSGAEVTPKVSCRGCAARVFNGIPLARENLVKNIPLAKENFPKISPFLSVDGNPSGLTVRRPLSVR